MRERETERESISSFLLSSRNTFHTRKLIKLKVKLFWFVRVHRTIFNAELRGKK